MQLFTAVHWRARSYAAYAEALPVAQRTILYEARQGRVMGGGPLAVCHELLRDPEYAQYDHVWALDAGVARPAAFRQLPQVRFVRRDSARYLQALATAKYVLNDGSFDPYFSRRPEQVYVNIWHAAPLDAVGKRSSRALGSHANVQRNLLHVTHLVTPNRHTTDALLDALDLATIFPGQILEVGSPRVDLILAADRDAVRRRLGVRPDQRLVLYAPAGLAASDVDGDRSAAVKVAHRLGCALGPGSKVVVPAQERGGRVPFGTLSRALVPSTEELLAACDVLVTDFAAIAFDFLAMRRPMLFYAGSSGQAGDRATLLEPLPGSYCATFEDLVAALHDGTELDAARYDEAIAAFCCHRDGRAARRVVNVALRGQSDPRVRVCGDPSKKNLLVHGGRFRNNGITVSFINLALRIDGSRYAVHVIGKDAYSEQGRANLQRLPPHVKLVFGTPPLPGLEDDRSRRHPLLWLLRRRTEKDRWASWRREARRLLGDARFDVVIDFSGYVPYWSLVLAAVPATRRVIYQHNDMLREYHKVIGGKLRHKDALDIVFNTYRSYDRVVSVASHTRDVNASSLAAFVDDRKLVVVHNVLPPTPEAKPRTAVLRGEDESPAGPLVEPPALPSPQAESFGYRRPQPGETCFVNVGRLSPEKGQATLVRAFARLKKQYPAARLYIAGDGPLRKALARQIARADLETTVFLTGHIEDPLPLVASCDCFVLSSMHEGQPMVLLEAMALQKPIVVTDIPACRSVVELGYGHLVGTGEEALHGGLVDYLQGLVKAEPFDVDAYNGHAMAMFYREVCGESEAGTGAT